MVFNFLMALYVQSNHFSSLISKSYVRKISPKERQKNSNTYTNMIRKLLNSTILISAVATNSSKSQKYLEPKLRFSPKNEVVAEIVDKKWKQIFAELKR